MQLLREAGAKEVHFRSSAPKFLYPCYFGTDIDSRENLIAANSSTQEIAEMIGVDSLGFLSVESVKPVSYTHLDVYKRQAWHCAHPQFLPRCFCPPGRLLQR